MAASFFVLHHYVWNCHKDTEKGGMDKECSRGYFLPLIPACRCAESFRPEREERNMLRPFWPE